jgi:hypothetical protein
MNRIWIPIKTLAAKEIAEINVDFLSIIVSLTGSVFNHTPYERSLSRALPASGATWMNSDTVWHGYSLQAAQWSTPFVVQHLRISHMFSQ